LLSPSFVECQREIYSFNGTWKKNIKIPSDIEGSDKFLWRSGVKIKFKNYLNFYFALELHREDFYLKNVSQN
jgi:hypothetical protein